MSLVRRQFIALFLVLLCLSSCSFSLGNKGCTSSRYGAFDVGSGTTKALVAELSSCGNDGVKVVWEESRALGLKEDLLAHGKLSEAMMNQSAEVLAELAAKMRQSGAKILGGVGTMALREANNGEDFAAAISEISGVEISIITQKEEALLGALSARALRPDVKSQVVWDIGGASAQWIYASENKTKVELSSLASVSLKDAVVKFQGKKSGSSANPLGKKAVQFAQERVLSEVKKFDPALKASIKASDSIVLGVGGVHRFSVLRQVGGQESYEVSAVRAAIEKRFNWSDSQVGGAYAATDVTNLILVYTQMKNLGIKRVEVAPGNLALGHILSSLVTQKHSSP